jgi:hypothetical protein
MRRASTAQIHSCQAAQHWRHIQIFFYAQIVQVKPPVEEATAQFQAEPR